MTTRRPGLLGATALLAVLTLSGCSTEGPTAEVGECLNHADLGEEVSEIHTLPCEEPHDSEVFHSFEMPEEPYPGDEAVTEAAEQGCLVEFEEFVGTDYYDSDLYITYLPPQERSWQYFGHRTVLCIATAEEPVTGSLKGSNR